MRKLTKKALSLLLCVMLIATAISCAFSITAETVGSTTVNGMTVYDAPVGLDLNGDLSTWVGNVSTAGNPMYVAQDGVLKADVGVQDQTGNQPVGPAYFKIPNATKGTEVSFSFYLEVDEDAAKANNHYYYDMFSYEFIQYNPDGTVKATTGIKQYKAYSVDTGAKKSDSLVIENPDEFFQIVFRSAKSVSYAWSVSEINVDYTIPEVVVDTEYEIINGKKVYAEPVGLDFSEDLNTWVGNVSTAGNPMYAAQDGVLKADVGVKDQASNQPVGPAYFKIPDAVKGTEVSLSFYLEIDEDAAKANSHYYWNTFSYEFVHYDASGNVKATTGVIQYKAYSADTGTKKSDTFTIEDPDEFFQIIFRSAKDASYAWSVSEINVDYTIPEVVVDTEYEIINSKKVYAEPVGLDFSEGLKTWINNTTPKGNPMYVAEGDVLRASGLYDYETGKQPVGPAYFKIPNAVEGMAVQLSFDLRTEREGLDSTQTGVDQGWTMLYVEFVQYNADGTQKATTGEIAYYPDSDGKKTSDPFTIEDPDEFFQIIFKSPRNPGLAWRVSNIVVTTTQPNANGAPLYYGNEENGFVSTGSSWPQKLKPSEEIDNLDFSYGFIYWSGRDSGADLNGTFASDSFKLDGDETNKYITLKDEGYVDSMRTALFNASNYDVGVDDKLVLIYDAMGDDVQQLRVTLVQDHLREARMVYDDVSGLASNNVSPGTPNTLVDKNAKLSALATSGDWTTYVTGVSKLVNDPTAVNAECIENIYLQIVIEAVSDVAVGDQLDAAIDNIRIAKIDNGAYYDITTGEKIADMTINAETLTSVTDVILRGPVDYAADFNNDKKVDILDLVYLKKKLAGKVEN